MKHENTCARNEATTSSAVAVGASTIALTAGRTSRISSTSATSSVTGVFGLVTTTS